MLERRAGRHRPGPRRPHHLRRCCTASLAAAKADDGRHRPRRRPRAGSAAATPPPRPGRRRLRLPRRRRVGAAAAASRPPPRGAVPSRSSTPASSSCPTSASSSWSTPRPAPSARSRPPTPAPRALRRGGRRRSGPTSPAASAAPAPTTCAAHRPRLAARPRALRRPGVASGSRPLTRLPLTRDLASTSLDAACWFCCSAVGALRRSLYVRRSSAAAARYAVRFTNLGAARPGRPQAPGLAPPRARHAFLLALVALVVGFAQPARDDQGAPRAGHDHARHRHVAVDGGHRRRPDPHRGGPGRGQGVRRPAARRRSTSAWSPSTATPRSRCRPTTDRDAVQAGHRQRSAGRAHRHRRGHLRQPRRPQARCPAADGTRGAGPHRADVRRHDHRRPPNDEAVGRGQARPRCRCRPSPSAPTTAPSPSRRSRCPIPVPVDKDALQDDRRRTPAARSSRPPREGQLKQVYENIGSSVGYVTEQREISTVVHRRGALSCCSSPAASASPGSSACPDALRPAPPDDARTWGSERAPTAPVRLAGSGRLVAFGRVRSGAGADLLADHAGRAAGLHGDAVEAVGRLHRALLVAHDDQLGLVAELVRPGRGSGGGSRRRGRPRPRPSRRRATAGCGTRRTGRPARSASARHRRAATACGRSCPTAGPRPRCRSRAGCRGR